MIARFFVNVIERPKLVFFFVAILSALALWQIPKATLDADVVGLFLDDSERSDNFRKIISTFGAPEPAFVAWKTNDALSDESLNKQREVARVLKAYPDIEEVIALPDVPFLEEGGTLSFRTLAESLREEKGFKARRSLLKKARFAKRLLSKDGQSAAMIVSFVTTEPIPLPLQFSAENRIRDAFVAQKLAPAEAVHIAGIVTTNAVLLSAVQQNLTLLLPLTFILLLAIVLYFYRSFWPVFIAALIGGIAVLWATGVAIVYDPKFSVLHSITPMLIATLSLADTIFLINAYVRALDELKDPKEAVRRAIEHVTPACVLTSLLSLLSFASLMLMPVHLFQLLGLATGIGVFSALILVLSVAPFLLVRYRPSEQTRRALTTGISVHIAMAFHNATRAFPKVFVALALLTTLFVIPILNLEYETDMAGRFSKDHRVPKAETFIRNNFGSYVPIEIMVSSNQGVLRGEFFKRVDAFENALSTLKHSGDFASVPTALRPGVAALVNDDSFDWSDALIEQVLLMVGDVQSSDAFVSSDQKSMRLTVLTSAKGFRKQAVHANKIDKLAKTIFKDEQVVVSGLGPLLGGWLDVIYDAQKLGLLLMGLSILIFLTLGFRSFRSAFVSLLPNALPLCLFMGTMALFGDRFDSDYLVLLIVGLGLVVDDTIHFVMHYRRVFKGDIEEALADTSRSAGAAMVQTSCILIIGLSPLALSEYSTVRMFSVELSKIVCFALLADLLVLPALIRLRWIR